MLLPNDFGPIYTETDMARFPVEPWNTYSNLIFFLIIVYYTRKVLPNYKKHQTLVFALPILLIGFIGGTVFHATRSHSIWLFLDFIPILILAITASVHFWLALGISKYLVPLYVLVPMFLVRFLRVIAPFLGISFGYIALATTILLPAYIFARRHKWQDVKFLIASTLLFALAVAFRILDKVELLPMGTHFLWHIFGGISAGCLFEYIYRSQKLSHNV